jgi:putative ABC transport system ATP-binding protein
MIEVKNLSITFNPGTEQEFKALQNVSLAIPEGQFVILLGSNGSGKSTLLNVIAGNLSPERGQGEILINNQIVTRKAVHQRSPFIGRIFQQPSDGVASDLSVLENFRLAALRTSSKGLNVGTGKAFRAEVAYRVEVLGMGLENRLDRPIGSFSGGQRQALSLLMATYVKPKLLLLDEPTAALDPKSAETVFNLACTIIKEQQLTALMVTHDLRHCIQAGDRIIQLSEGKIIRDEMGVSRESLSLADIQGWF